MFYFLKHIMRKYENNIIVTTHEKSAKQNVRFFFSVEIIKIRKNNAVVNEVDTVTF